MRFTLSTDTVCDVFKSELKARGIDYVSHTTPSTAWSTRMK